jgi:hypothetical protein
VAQPAPSRTSFSQQYLETALLSLAREEQQGRPKQRRLLEPELATWQRFRGRLGLADFVDLLLQDASIARPYLFSPSGIPGLRFSWQEILPEQLQALLESVARQALAMQIPELPEARTSESIEYIQGQARRLGLPSKMARSDLPRGLKPQHRVLELPGTGGQLAHYLARELPELKFHEVFTLAASNWQEWTLAGVVAVESGVLDPIQLEHVPALEALRGQDFDFVLGILPEKGGTFPLSALQEFFPHARVYLV